MYKPKQLTIISLVFLVFAGTIIIATTRYKWQPIDLIDMVINELKGARLTKENFLAIERAQRVYHLETGKFTDSFQKLGIGITPNSKKYNYYLNRGIQTSLNDYLFLGLDTTEIEQSLKIPEEESFTPPKKLPRISPDIIMITAQPKKAGLKTYIAFVVSCMDPSTGGSDCEHESVTFAITYQSEQPLTLPPTRLKVSLPLAYCPQEGCLRRQFPIPEGFHPIVPE